jgi:hypothetical protein
MWRVRQLLVPATAVGVGLVISACGGDSSPETLITVPTQTTTGLTKTEFIAQADSACAEANAAIEQFAAAGQGVSEADQIAQLRQGVVDQVNEFGPPAEDKATLDQFLTAMRAQVAAGQKIALATERGEDTAEFEAELDAAKSDAETAASAYGFQECGSQISSSGTSTAVAPDTGGAVTPAEPTAPAPAPAPAPSTGDSGGTEGGGTAGGGTGGDTGGDTGGTGSGSGGIGPG